jgi:hypothetical protein
MWGDGSGLIKTGIRQGWGWKTEKGYEKSHETVSQGTAHDQGDLSDVLTGRAEQHLLADAGQTAHLGIAVSMHSSVSAKLRSTVSLRC